MTSRGGQGAFPALFLGPPEIKVLGKGSSDRDFMQPKIPNHHSSIFWNNVGSRPVHWGFHFLMHSLTSLRITSTTFHPWLFLGTLSLRKLS
jgi:hypothetical protein